MKKIIPGVLMACFTLFTRAQTVPVNVIIPAPVAAESRSGSFLLDKTVLLQTAGPEDAATADLLNAFIAEKSGFALRQAAAPEAGHRSILLTDEGADQLPEEGYLLEISPDHIRITGKAAGLFYGVQSLMQLLPEKKEDGLRLSACRIKDYPRFKYRGMHLDVTRHAFPVAFIKKYIDLMSRYKLNNFHWHLTDDQGWRIEIRKYPKLTSAGSVRNGTIIGHYPGVANDQQVYRGYYTQQELKDVVAYAARRFINVIPEIEMPGHASAAIAAYPGLSVFPERNTFVSPQTPWAGTRKGKQVQQTWGVFDDVFAPTEYTFRFLEDVLDEVMAIFPSRYIHIGGDECPKTYWKESAFCQQLIKEKGLKDEHGLQSWFIQRIEKYVNSKGRSVIGWDEILEGGLAPNATVMSWRGEEGGIAAAGQQHDVIMTPGNKGFYFDHAQSANTNEPVNIGGNSPYSVAYNYDPVPAVLTESQRKYITGVQANLWTEYIETPEKVWYMVLPRMFALSEVAWSLPEQKDFQKFSEDRVPLHLARLDREGINFRVPSPLGQPETPLEGAGQTIMLKVPVTGAGIFYTLDGTTPSEVSTRYTSPLKLEIPAGHKLELKTIVITPGGKRSVVTTTPVTPAGS